MKKTILKILKYVLIGVCIWVALWLIEIGIIYAVKGEDTWNFLREYWEWYKTFLSIQRFI